MPQIEISTGELLDKITILKIKKENIKDIEKLNNINKEIEILKEKAEEFFKNPEIKSITDELLLVNKKLWDIEDKLRILEKLKKFDDEFKELARQVYKTHDARFVLKDKINNITNSTIKEQKSYQ
jgi:hypothetical protein